MRKRAHISLICLSCMVLLSAIRSVKTKLMYKNIAMGSAS